MTTDLQQDLDKLVMDHWSLVHDLRGHAERLRRKVLDESRRQVEAGLDRERYPKLVFEKNATSWWVGWRNEKTLLAYVSVSVPDRLSRFGAVVDTVFASTVGSYQKVKSAAEQQFGSRFAGQWESSMQTSRTVRRELHADEGDVEALVERAAEEVLRQLEVAEFLARYPRQGVTA